MGPGIYDRPQALTVSLIYALPKVRGNRMLGAVANNWNVSTIVNYQTGIPFNVLAGRDLSGDNVAGGDRPDIVDRSILGKTYNNPNVLVPRAAFASPVPVLPTATSPGKVGTYGTLPRNAFRRDGVHNWDIAAVRRFPIREKTHLEVRSEFFNAFNQAQFNGPVINLGLVRLRTDPQHGEHAA